MIWPHGLHLAVISSGIVEKRGNSILVGSSPNRHSPRKKGREKRRVGARTEKQECER